MTRTRTLVLTALVVTLAGGAAFGQAKTPYVPPVKGQALLEILAPQTKPVGNDVVTVIRVKNVSTGRIAGLKVDEYWYDKAQTIVTGNLYRHPKPMDPGEIITITIKTPKDPRMHQNQYNFSHANGTIKASPVKSLDAPKDDAKKPAEKKK